MHVGTKHFYLIFFWTEISLIYSQHNADYFIIYKRISSNMSKDLKGHRGENSWVEHEDSIKGP